MERAQAICPAKRSEEMPEKSISRKPREKGPQTRVLGAYR